MSQTTYKKADIIHIISGDLWAGASVQVFQMLSNLDQNEKNNILAILFNDAILNKKLIENGIDTLIIDEGNQSAFKIVKRIARVLKSRECKILHVHAYKEHLLGQLAILYSREKSFLFRTFHGKTATPKNLSIVRKLKSKVIHNVEKIFLNHHKINIIAVSKDLEKFLVH